jgi:hypothetical protein
MRRIGRDLLYDTITERFEDTEQDHYKSGELIRQRRLK